MTIKLIKVTCLVLSYGIQLTRQKYENEWWKQKTLMWKPTYKTEENRRIHQPVRHCLVLAIHEAERLGLDLVGCGPCGLLVTRLLIIGLVIGLVIVGNTKGYGLLITGTLTNGVVPTNCGCFRFRFSTWWTKFVEVANFLLAHYKWASNPLHSPHVGTNRVKIDAAISTVVSESITVFPASVAAESPFLVFGRRD